MARKSKPANALPSREQIKNFIEESPGPVGRREIARAFNVKGAARVELKKLLILCFQYWVPWDGLGSHG